MNPAEFQFRLLHTFLMGCLVVGVTLVWFESRDQNSRLWSEYLDHSRRSTAVDLYNPWRDLLDLSDARITLEMVRSEQLNSADLLRGNEPYDIEIEGQQRIPSDQVIEMRRHIISVLNLFEQIAAAEQAGIADEAVIRDAFGGAIIDHYGALSPFIAAWQTEMERAAGWDLLESAVADWERRGWAE